MLGKKKSYATLTAPLQKMMNDLIGYVKEQQANIRTLTAKKNTIDKQIDTSTLEIAKSNMTVDQIKTMVVTDEDAKKALESDKL